MSAEGAMREAAQLTQGPRHGLMGDLKKFARVVNDCSP